MKNDRILLVLAIKNKIRWCPDDARMYTQPQKSGIENLGKIYQTSNDHNLVNNKDKNMFKNIKWNLKCSF